MKKLVYWGAAWCGQCKALRPKVEAWCKSQGIEFEFIDADGDAEIPEGLRSLPAMFLYDGTNLVCKAAGMDGFKKIKEEYGNINA